MGACGPGATQPALTHPAPVEVEQATQTLTTSQPELPTPTRTERSTSTTVSRNAFEGNLPLAARVNNQPVFLDSYEQQVAQLEQALQSRGADLPGKQEQELPARMRQQVLEGLIDQTIIEQQAKALGISLSEETVEVQAQEIISQAQDQVQFEAWLVENGLIYESFKQTLRAQLIANRVFEQVTEDVPDTAEQIHVWQIFVTDEADARSLIEQLKAGVDFAQLAREYSLDERSRAGGGNLGWFPQRSGILPPEVESWAFSLEPGQVSGPLQTEFGFYIIKLENREAGRPLTIEMRQVLKNQIFIDWLMEQRSLSTVERFVP